MDSSSPLPSWATCRKFNSPSRETPLHRVVCRLSAEDQMRFDFERYQRCRHDNKTTQIDALLKWYETENPSSYTLLGTVAYPEGPTSQPIPNRPFSLIVSDVARPRTHALKMAVCDWCATTSGDIAMFTAAPCCIEDGQVRVASSRLTFYRNANSEWSLDGKEVSDIPFSIIWTQSSM